MRQKQIILAALLLFSFGHFSTSSLTWRPQFKSLFTASPTRSPSPTLPRLLPAQAPQTTLNPEGWTRNRSRQRRCCDLSKRLGHIQQRQSLIRDHRRLWWRLTDARAFAQAPPQHTLTHPHSTTPTQKHTPLLCLIVSPSVGTLNIFDDRFHTSSKLIKLGGAIRPGPQRAPSQADPPHHPTLHIPPPTPCESSGAIKTYL